MNNSLPIKEIKVACHHCGQNIAFPAEALGLEVNCPHCQQSTLLAAGTAPPADHRPPPIASHAQPAPGDAPETLSGGVIALVLMLVVLGVGFLYNLAGGEGSSSDPKADAFYTAKEFIRQQYPGAKEFGDESEAVIQLNGNSAFVAVPVKGVNVFNAPVKNVVGVEMERAGTKWILIQIKAQ